MVPGLEPMSYSVISFPSGKGSPEKAADLVLVARNISRTGLGIRMPGLLPKGTVLNIRLPNSVDGGTNVTVAARITWCVFMKGSEFQAGLEFMIPGFQARAAIDALIRDSV